MNKPQSRPRAAYLLVRIFGDRGRRIHEFAPSLHALAIAAAIASGPNGKSPWYEYARPANWVEHRLRALSPLGQTFNPVELAAWGRRLLSEESRSSALRSPYWAGRYAPVKGYVRRQGPVPGIHKRHNSRWLRAPATAQERRLNQQELFVQGIEDAPGHAPARPKRQGFQLPSDRDDLQRRPQRSWKAQHKGRKAWEHS